MSRGRMILRSSGRYVGEVVSMAACPELPKEAASSGFHPPPRTLAALLAGPLEAKNAFRPAKVGLRSRDSGSVGDALTPLNDSWPAIGYRELGTRAPSRQSLLAALQSIEGQAGSQNTPGDHIEF